MQACSKLDMDYVHKACQSIRKTEGAANTKEVTMEMEHRLVMLCEYAKWQYITDGDMAPGACDIDMLEAVYEWKEQLQDDPEDSSVEVFTEKANKKIWFESIRGFFTLKKGYSGYPLLYVIRNEDDPIDPAPAWGTPTIYSYLETQGRHNGRLYASDNATVWRLLMLKCLGTTAWDCIRSFEATRDGRGAFLVLVGQYMGSNVAALLLKRAETTLGSITFDGRSKYWTWDKFVGRFREALHDLGDDNQMSEERKVVKFMSAFNVSHLSYCEAIVMHDPRLSGSLDATITFLGQQLVTSQLKNGPGTRTVGSVDTTDEDGIEEASTDEEQPTAAKADSTEHEPVDSHDEMKGLQLRIKTLEDFIAKHIAQQEQEDPEDQGDSKHQPAWLKMNGSKKPAWKAGTNKKTPRKASALSSQATAMASGDALPPRKLARVDMSDDSEDETPTKAKSTVPPSLLKSPPLKSFTIYPKRS